MAKVTVLENNLPGRVYRIKKKLTIGRDIKNDVQLIDAKVSRRHTVIEEKKGFFIIRDLGSRNGTFVNEVQITERELVSGDRLRVGDTELLFESEPIIDGMLSSSEGKLQNGSASTRIMMLDRTFELKHLGKIDASKETTPQLKKVLEQLTTLFDVSQIINTVRDSRELLNALLEQIMRVIHADRCYVLLKDDKSDRLVPAAVRTTDGEDSEIQISNTIVKQVLEEGISLLSPDAFQDERFLGSESIFIHSIRSAMCVPLRSRENIVGIIHVDTKASSGSFSEEDLKMLTAIGITAGVAIENIRLYENLKRLFRSTVRSLVAAIEANDRYTGGHSLRVSEYSRKIAECMGLPDDEVEKIELAALLHDVGKVGISELILNKPGSFTDEEREVMKSHPVLGADILSKIEDMEEIAKIVKHHHERFDGHGYPDGLEGSMIPLESRILSVADTLDAITTDRSYRKKKSIDQALKELIEYSGSQFDPDIVKVLKRCVVSGSISSADNFTESEV